MLTSEFKPWHVPVFLAKYAYLTATRRPVLVHFEVTMRCNARCGFCDYWKTDPSAKATELASFADAARCRDPDFGVEVVNADRPPGMDESAALVALLTAICRPSLPLAPSAP